MASGLIFPRLLYNKSDALAWLTGTDGNVPLRRTFGEFEIKNELPRKAERCNPYRKPTQVVEESILRRSSDSWLRN